MYSVCGFCKCVNNGVQGVSPCHVVCVMYINNIYIYIIRRLELKFEKLWRICTNLVIWPLLMTVYKWRNITGAEPKRTSSGT